MGGKYTKGRGAQVNPTNRFAKLQYTGETPEDMDEALIDDKRTSLIKTYPKTIITKVNSPDLGFHQSLNPYQGCEHGCIYCYARNSHAYWGYGAGLDFEQKILVKMNAVDLLKKELNKSSYKPQVIFMSGNTDCYQPVERKLGITRALLSTLLDYRHPVSLISKNVLMLRDLDILAALSEMNLVHISITINSLREEVRRKMEPRTATADARLKLIERLAEHRIPVSLMLAPIVPGINSDEIPALIKSAADAGADWASYTVVRLNGEVADVFTDWLNKCYPDRAQKVLNGIAACHGGRLNDNRWGKRIKGDGVLVDSMKQLFDAAIRKYMGKKAYPVLCDSFFERPDVNKQLSLF